VPVFVMAIIAGIWYYRRYRLRLSQEDHRRIVDPMSDGSSLAVINLAEVNHKHNDEDNNSN